MLLRQKKNLPHLFLSILFFLQSSISSTAQEEKDPSNYPKIGVTLSGGGAKGLAHIYVLKALDSAGLRVDNITGTSIGAVVGGVYAAGYSANTIEKIAKSIDWDNLFSDNVPIKNLAVEEKNTNTKYAFHLPLKEEGISEDGSLMQGQALWKKLSQLLFPVMHLKNFDSLPIAFRAYTAKIETGEGKLLKSGNLMESIRASMAVPIVFSPVTINDTLLVDGGIVRNLPVQEVIDMGSDYVIGISLTKGGYWHHEFNKASEYLNAMIFYNAAKDYDQQKLLCNYFYEYDLKKFSSASFNRIPEIMEVGQKSFDSLYHKFKRVKDSLDAIYGATQKPTRKVNTKTTYRITKINVLGLSTPSKASFLQLISLKLGKDYAYKELQKQVDFAFSTNRYKSIYFNLNEIAPNHYEIEFKAVEKPSAFIDLGLQYSDFEGINLLGDIKKYGLTARQSKSYLGVSIGKNFRLKTYHVQPLFKNAKFGIKPFINLENVTLDFIDPTDEQKGEYKQRQFEFGATLLTLNHPKWQLGLQWHLNRFALDPKFFIDYQVDGSNTLGTVSSFFEFNTLNSINFPKKGIRIHLNFSYIYHQNNKLKLVPRNENPVTFSNLELNFKPYQKINFNADSYIPISRKFNWQTQLQAHANFKYQQNFVDNYFIGGIQNTFYNQVTFIGLPESSILTPSFASVLFQLRYNFLRKLYLSSAANFATYNYLDTNNNFNFNTSISGYNASLSYLSRIGPFQFSAAYTPRNNKWSTLFYFGIMF